MFRKYFGYFQVSVNDMYFLTPVCVLGAVPMTSKTISRKTIMCSVIVLLYLIRLEKKRGAGNP